MEKPQETKQVFILKKDAQSMKQVETFLKNRGWTVNTALAVKEALAKMLKNPPDLVLVSVEHSFPRIKVLPKILAQALRCTVIPYANDGSPAVMRILNELSPEYSLFPPVSGPAVERMLNKIQKKLEEAKDNYTVNEKGEKVYMHDKSMELISITGKVNAEGGDTAISGAREALTKMLAGDDSVHTAIDNSATVQKGTDARSAAHLQKGTDARTEAMVQKGNDALTEAMVDKGHLNNNPAHFNPQVDGRQSLLTEKDLTPQSVSKMAKGIDHGSGTVADSNAALSFFAPSDDDQNRKADLESILEKGIKESLEGTFTSQANRIHSLAEITNAACIVIKSQRFSGYLIIAMAPDQKMDDKLLTNLRDRLFKSLESGGEKLMSSEQMHLKLDSVNFNSWTEKSAELVCKANHCGDEIALAFFPLRNVQLNLKECSNQNMWTLDIQDLQGNAKVEFDVYVHLAENDKYILYTPKNGVFYEKQKDRLIGKGIKQMHVRKDAIEDMKRYRAQNYLNGKIDKKDSGDAAA